MKIVDLKKTTTENLLFIYSVFAIDKTKEKEFKDTPENAIAFIKNVSNPYKRYEGFTPEILFIGDIENYPFYKGAVYKYTKKANGGKAIYRNYCVSPEEQEKHLHLVNVAEDPETSWNTVKSALGTRRIIDPCYGIIVKFIKNIND